MPSPSITHTIANGRFAEVVLSVLLSKFTFAPSTKPIFWNLSGVRYPTAGSDSQKPALPMQVALYKPAAAAAAESA